MYSRITATSNGREAIAYAEGEAHNDNEVRNLKVTPINMLPTGNYADQMQPLWNKAAHKHKVQVRRIIISFSKKECDPGKPEDIEKANHICKAFTRKYYKDRQAVIYMQADGKGGMLHAHILVNDVSITDHKACTDEQKHYTYVKRGINEVASQYIKLDFGEKTQAKQTQTERIKTEKAAEIRERLREDGVDLTDEEMRNLLIDENAYSYKDDMKQRIREAISEAASEEDFEEILKGKGIVFEKKTSKKYGEYYTYDFVECPVGVKNTKSRSYKMGDVYSPEAIRNILALKQTTQEAQEGTQKDLFEVFDDEVRKPLKIEIREPGTPEDDFNEWVKVYHPEFVFKKADGEYDFDAFDRLTAEWKEKKWMQQKEEPEAEHQDPEEQEKLEAIEEPASKGTARRAKRRGKVESNTAEVEKQKVKEQMEQLKKDKQKVSQILPESFDWETEIQKDETPDYP